MGCVWNEPEQAWVLETMDFFSPLCKHRWFVIETTMICVCCHYFFHAKFG